MMAGCGDGTGSHAMGLLANGSGPDGSSPSIEPQVPWGRPAGAGSRHKLERTDSTRAARPFYYRRPADVAVVFGVQANEPEASARVSVAFVRSPGFSLSRVFVAAVVVLAVTSH